MCGDDWNATKVMAEKALQIVKSRLDHSLLSLNVEKTKFVSFALSHRSLPDFQALTLHNYQCSLELDCTCNSYVERKSSVKYLEVHIEIFSWKEQAQCVTNKIRKLIYKFYELRNIFDFKPSRSIYLALVESVISYGIVVWGYSHQ